MNMRIIYSLSVPATVIIIGFGFKGADEVAFSKPVEKILTQQVWKAEEIRVQLSDNTDSYYKRGSSGTIYDTDSLKFEKNNTGTYYYEGAEHPINWQFTDPGKTKMTIVIHQSPAITVYLENVHITKRSFKYAQYYKGPGAHYLASCTRVPN